MRPIVKILWPLAIIIIIIIIIIIFMPTGTMPQAWKLKLLK